MIDLHNETLISLAEAAKLVPPARRGKRAHLSTVLRWIIDGARTPCGNVVKLEGIRLGGRWLTSKQALQRFAEALTPDLFAENPHAPRSPGARQRASERAEQELNKMGL
jgi:hypothetical protein